MNADAAMTEAAAIDIPPHYELLRDDIGFSHLIGPLYVRKPRDGRTLAWGFRAVDKHLNRGGIVHGGMLLTFADHCFGAMAYMAAGKKPSSTIDLSASFIAPGRPGDWIECTGTVSRTTRELVFISGQITADGRTLADLKGIWKLLSRWLGPETKK